MMPGGGRAERKRANSDRNCHLTKAHEDSARDPSHVAYRGTEWIGHAQDDAALNGGTRPQATTDELNELLTVEDVAALFKVTRGWVYEHTRSRDTPRSERLPHIKIGKYLRFEARALQAFLEKKCRTT